MGLGIKTETEHKQDPFDDFLDSLKQPRQVMTGSGMDIMPTDDGLPAAGDIPDVEDESTELEDPAEQKRRYSLSMIPAETMVNCVDIAFVQVTSIIAKQKTEGATREEKDSLIQAAANYMKEKDIDISPGAMLVVMVLVIYGPKVWQAVELRKANEEKEALQNQLEEEKKKVEMLETLRKAEKEAKNG